jgi:hypothetical protein
VKEAAAPPRSHRDPFELAAEDAVAIVDGAPGSFLLIGGRPAVRIDVRIPSNSRRPSRRTQPMRGDRRRARLDAAGPALAYNPMSVAADLVGRCDAMSVRGAGAVLLLRQPRRVNLDEAERTC